MTHAPVYTYFPGCSLATSARENDDSMRGFAAGFGVRLEELGDWNCCGSSSAHSIDDGLAFQLACRNLSLAPPGRPLLVACPSCYLRLKGAYLRLQGDPPAAAAYESAWGRAVDPELRIVHFFELLDSLARLPEFQTGLRRSLPLRVACYYGCMLAHPPALKTEPSFYGLMENALEALGATPLAWPFAARCCGTFLTVARPDIAAPLVAQIVEGAVEAGAACIVTACAMCHLNLEVRSPRRRRVPVFHFSELLALALDLPLSDNWFARHLIDPRPLLRATVRESGGRPL